MNNITEKFTRKIKNILVIKNKDKKWYFWLYPAYWHAKLTRKEMKGDGRTYLTAGLNSGAGIGHQMGFWFDGFLLARRWGIPYAQRDFFINGQHSEPDDMNILFQIGRFRLYNTSGEWNRILGLGKGEKTVEELRKQKYKIRTLPLFDPCNDVEVRRIRQIMESYCHENIVFQLEIDQGGDTRLEYIPLFREMFWNNQVYAKKKLMYCDKDFNIAIHIRRGDVDQIIDNGGRYNDNAYYVTALQTAYSLISDEQYKMRKIFVFSEGKENDFPEFQTMENVTLCIGGSAKEAFLHFAYADLTIVSKSGFSCLGAMLNDGMKLYQKGMHYKVPNDEKWIPLNENGTLWREVLR